MRYKAGLLTVLLGAGVTAVQAQVNLGLLTGFRDESGSEDRLAAVGFTADFGRSAWVLRPEIGIFASFDPIFGGQETEISLGLLHSWTRPKVRLNLGAGLTSISSDFGFNQGAATVGYVHGGAEWLREERASLGLDLRYVGDSEIEVDGTSFGIGYLQAAFRMTWKL
ncbi:MAG TPA: hypothetical protein VN783_14350 [Thermoanaerobaculia bacterium]|nr:hypothetical protein [Thermoanaerobaculia bacterium]